MTRAAIAVVVLALIAAACTGDGASDPSTEPTLTTTDPTTAATDSPTPATVLDGPAPGSLVVVSETGAIATMRPDGSDTVELTEAGDELLQFLQPTWSPDGARVAFTRLDARSGSPEPSLVTVGPDGSGATSADLAFAPFYLYWEPGSRRLAYLGSGVGTLELRLLDVGGGGTETTVLDRGQPYYFSWAPDGGRYLAHVGSDRLDIVEVGAEPSGVDAVPGAFQAPVWTEDRLFYAEADEGTQRLLAVPPSGGEPTVISQFDRFVQFVVDPAGRRVAFQGDGGDTVTAAGPGVLVSNVTAQGSLGGLRVYDLGAGTTSTVTLDPALAFFWSPDGDKLLSLIVADGDPTRLRWEVWEPDGGTTFTSEPMQPSRTLLRDYLPFFDQYAQSLSFWAPDGSAFVWAGADADGTEGIWVQRVIADAPPKRIAGGGFAAWSP